ncbi:MAG: hypothetical protein ABS68_11165 [Niastella sp. SCN 39-18]|nr:hypothetical protein [Sphingobacteriales bacterium]ODT51936.1 MAG: hypothetical protein ABS68_11165 [Niastella sp. SCN 39-18]OJW11518.1 MAG: hypothetical protein BGO53_11315 [Sphingobacteriales bacterium 39-19]
MRKSIFYFILAFFSISLVACKKENLSIDKDPLVPREVARFVLARLTDSTKTFFIPANNGDYKIPVGFTTVSNEDRKITFSYTSTDATAGVQYQAPASVTIPAGKALDTLRLTGLFGGFSSASQIDTVVIRITDQGAAPSTAYILPTKITIYLRQFCDESSPVLSMFAGTYAHTNELFGTGAYGPYTTTMGVPVPLTATTAKISVSNIYDTGWGPIDFTLDWSNPAALKTTVIAGTVPGADAGDLNSAYAGLPVVVRAHATTPFGSFSGCTQTFTLYMQLGVGGLGYFSDVYRVILNR